MTKRFTILDVHYGDSAILHDSVGFAELVDFANELMYESPEWQWEKDPSRLWDIIGMLETMEYEVIVKTGGARR